MKAIISNKIYLTTPEDSDTLKGIYKALTYKIRKKAAVPTYDKIETIKTYSIVSGGVIAIPQGRMDLIPEGYEIEDRRVLNSVPFPDPKIPLRQDQSEEVVDRVTDSCFINAKPGWGKTFAALHVAAKLGQKTLVVTHTVDLRKQWQKEVKLLFGMDAGVIGSGEQDIEDHFIVIANIQTLVKVFDSVAKEFGTIILDEAHHCPASSFTDIINKSHARYRIALSGTMERLDGKHLLFKDYFGATVYKPPPANVMHPEVHVINTGIVFPKEGDWAQKINALLYDVGYQKTTALVCSSYVKLGHKVLVVADRVDFLRQVAEHIGPRALLITGTEGDRENLLEKLKDEYDVVVASRSIFSEGISVNILSCVVMPQPSGNAILLDQLTARVTRKYEGKIHPVVWDMRLKGGTTVKQY
jgi:superfamily II DNA or RNA helicase